MKSESILPLVLVVLLAVSASAGTYSGGDGSAEYPYRIATPNDLNAIGNHEDDWDAHFVMVNDVNLADYTGTQFNIIGNITTPFTGVFDGNDHVVSNFSYSSTAENRVGLFGVVRDVSAMIHNLVLVDPNIDAGTGFSVGAIVGDLGEGTIYACDAMGVSVSGSGKVGGLIGRQYLAEVLWCCCEGDVRGGFSVGGLVGFNNQDAHVTSCRFVGTVSGDVDVGGLVGFNEGRIANCYSLGQVDGNDSVGGLIGINEWDVVVNCYSAAQVSVAPSAGAFVGDDFSHNYISCFWDTTASPLLPGIGNGSDPNVVGKTTVEMQTEATFTDAGWDFIEIWNIGENQTYPYLKVYPAGDLNHDGRVDLYDFAITASHWLEGVEDD